MTTMVWSPAMITIHCQLCHHPVKAQSMDAGIAAMLDHMLWMHPTDKLTDGHEVLVFDSAFTAAEAMPATAADYFKIGGSNE